MRGPARARAQVLRSIDMRRVVYHPCIGPRTSRYVVDSSHKVKSSGEDPRYRALHRSPDMVKTRTTGTVQL